MLLKTFLQPGGGIHLNMSRLLLFCGLFDMGFWVCGQFPVSDLVCGVVVWEKQGVDGSWKLNLCLRKEIFQIQAKAQQQGDGGKKLCCCTLGHSSLDRRLRLGLSRLS